MILLIATPLLSKVSGVVLDSSDNSPLIGAILSIPNTKLGDITDENGYFEIDYDRNSTNLKVECIGYKTQIIAIDENQDIVIYMKSLSFRSDELVVTANKKLQSIQDVPISVSLISKDDLFTRNITSIDYALQYVPGVEVNQDNISIRGSSGFSFGVGSRSIFLQDGIPQLSADNNDIKFDLVPILFIDRVEVIKGAGSALYGTSALGGVINVITENPKPDMNIRARIYSGFYDNPKYTQWKWSDDILIDRGIDVGISKMFDNYGIVASVSGFDRDSYRRYDESERISLFLKQLYNFSDQTNIDLTANYSTSNTDDWVYWNSLDSALIPPNDTDESIRIKSDKLSISSQLKHILNENSFVNLKLGLFNTFFSNQLGVTNPEFRESTGNAYFLETQYSNNLNDYNSIIAGFEGRFNTVSSATYGNNSQSIIAAFAQIENTDIKDLIITAGLRIDKEILDTIDTDNQLSPKLGANYTLTEDIKLRGSYGRGFRAASIAERYASVQFQGFNVVFNPELASEVSNSVELGISIDALDSDHYLNFDFSGFYNKYENLIEPTFETTQAAVIKFKNIFDAEISGLELDMSYNYEKSVLFKSAVTLLNPRNLVERKDLKYRSNVLWYNTLRLSYMPFEIQFDYRYKSKYSEIDERLGVTIEDYDLKIDAHILDISLSAYSTLFNSKTKFTINLKNALNYYYLEMVGNMAPIRFLNFQIETSI